MRRYSQRLPDRFGAGIRAKQRRGPVRAGGWLGRGLGTDLDQPLMRLVPFARSAVMASKTPTSWVGWGW